MICHVWLHHKNEKKTRKEKKTKRTLVQCEYKIIKLIIITPHKRIQDQSKGQPGYHGYRSHGNLAGGL
jgi:hypothetical protein